MAPEKLSATWRLLQPWFLLQDIAGKQYNENTVGYCLQHDYGIGVCYTNDEGHESINRSTFFAGVWR